MQRSAAASLAHSIVNYTLKLNFEKLMPTIFFNFHYINIECMYIYISESLCKGVQVMATINLQCNSLSKIHSSVYFRLKIVLLYEELLDKQVNEQKES